MEQNWGYFFGKLTKAVEILITTPGDIRQRVRYSAEYIFMLDPDAVPPNCRDEVANIQKMLTRFPAITEPVYESSVDVTYRRTRGTTAVKIAQRIWTLYHVYQTELDILRNKN